MDGWMDGWMDGFTSFSTVFQSWAEDNVRLCAMEPVYSSENFALSGAIKIGTSRSVGQCLTH